MKEKVSVIGVGRLGLAFALLLDSNGYEVCGCDIDCDRIEELNQQTLKSDEPYINDLLNLSNIIFTTNHKVAFEYAPLVFIFVPTPSKEDGSYDHKHIEQIIGEFEQYARKYNPPRITIVIGCTVMPKYCAALQERLADLKVNVVYNPEFIAQGSILNGLRYADIVLTGGKVPMQLLEIYDKIMCIKPNFKHLSLTEAEIAKISINCFLTMKIAFANLIGEIAINSGETPSLILDAIGSDSRIGRKFLNYGFPAGGICLPRDQKALGVYAHTAGVGTTFTHDIDKQNFRHAGYLKDYWMKQNPDKSVPFKFSYLGYKEGVNILTESYQFKLCMELLKEGYKVVVPTVKMADVPTAFIDYDVAGMVLLEETENAIRIN